MLSIAIVLFTISKPSLEMKNAITAWANSFPAIWDCWPTRSRNTREKRREVHFGQQRRLLEFIHQLDRWRTDHFCSYYYQDPAQHIAPAPILAGMSYGSNYALGFVAMDQTHTTLATKQPAYTAAAIAATWILKSWKADRT